MNLFFIASNSPVVVRGLEEVLKDKYEIAGSSFEGNVALDFIKKNKPAIAILDIRNSTTLTGLEIATECKRLNIQTKIILFVSYPVIDFQSNVKTTNILGYLLKESSISTIKECISSVSKDIPFISEGIQNTNFFEKHIKDLTNSELKIIKLISKNKTTQQIAEILFISGRTVEKHRSNIIKKLNLSSENKSLNDWVKKHNHFL